MIRFVFPSGLLALSFILSSCLSGQARFYPPKQMVVKAEVANVRADQSRHSGKYVYDAKQETQIEKGEPVLVFQKEGDWLLIEAPEQLEFSHHNRWQGYPGWVLAETLTSKLKNIHSLSRPPLPEEKLRDKILAEAKKHEGNPYLWGGRSLHNPDYSETATGVDCSGLVNWAFRRLGWFIPRDSYEQYLRARPVEPSQLKPGDLFFFAKKENSEKIFHVGFYLGDEKIFEAPSSGEVVRELPFEERIGKKRKEIKNGELVGDRYVFFGSFFTGEQQ